MTWRDLFSGFSRKPQSADDGPSQPDTRSGHLADVADWLRRLSAGTPGAFLIIQVTPPDNFLQFTWTPEGFRLDHPLLTAAQKAREQQVRMTSARVGAIPQDYSDASGARFLNCQLSPEPVEAARQTAAVLTDVFQVSADTRLEFSGHGLGDIAA